MDDKLSYLILPLLSLSKCFLYISKSDTPTNYIFCTLFLHNHSLSLHYLLDFTIAPICTISSFFDTYVMGPTLIVCLSINYLWVSIIFCNVISQLLHATSRDWYWISSLVTRLTKPSWVEIWESFFINASTLFPYARLPCVG